MVFVSVVARYSLKVFSVLVFLQFFLQSQGAFAIDLTSAYERALAFDPTYQAAIEERQAGIEYESINRAAILPHLSMEYSDFPFNQSSNDRELLSSRSGSTSDARFGRRSGAISLRQVLYSRGAFARYEKGKSEAGAAIETLRSKEQAVAVRLLEAYLGVLLEHDKLDLVRAEKRALHEQLQLNRRLLSRGTGTVLDVVEAEARYDISIARELELVVSKEDAQRRLKSMIGLRPHEPLSVLQTIRSPFVPPPLTPPDFAAWHEMALAGNPDLASMREALEAARLEVKAQQAGHLPTIDLVASRSLEHSKGDSFGSRRNNGSSIGIQVRIPLYSGGLVSASTRQARARYRQAQHEGDARQVEILRELEKQYALSSTSLIKIESYRAAERSALTALEASKKGFHAGIRVNLDILNAIQQLHSVQKDLTEASYGYLLARLRLSFHAGAVSIKDIMQVSLLMKESDRDPERGADDRG